METYPSIQSANHLTGSDMTDRRHKRVSVIMLIQRHQLSNFSLTD